MSARDIHLLSFPRKHALSARHFRDIVLSSLADQEMLAYEASSGKWKNISAIPLSLIPTMDDAHIPDLETLSYGGAFAQSQIPVLADAKYPNALLRDGSRTSTGLQSFTSGIKTDTISEVILNAGVNADGVLHLDSLISADAIYLDRANNDVILYRKAANTLGIADDVTLDTAKLYFGNYVLLKSSLAGLIHFRNFADTDYANLRVGEMQIETNFIFTSSGVIQGGPAALNVEFKTGKAGFPPTWETVATMIGGATPNFQMDKAGDISGLAGKTIDMPLYKVGGVAGADGSFTTVDGKTVTVSKGLITSIV